MESRKPSEAQIVPDSNVGQASITGANMFSTDPNSDMKYLKYYALQLHDLASSYNLNLQGCYQPSALKYANSTPDLCPEV